MPFAQVGLLDADAYGIAQREAAAGRLSDDFVVRLVEDEEIALDVAHVCQSLDVRFVQFYVGAPVGQPRYVSVEFLADVFLHELHHFVLDRGAFRFGRYHLAFRGVFAKPFERLFVRRLAAVQVAGQQPVHHHVGIAPDGRGEVRVVGECQPVVADVVGRIVGFGHRADGHRRHGVLFGRALDLFQQFVHLFRHGAAFRGAEYPSETQDELTETVELLLVGGVVYAVHHRAGRAAALVVRARTFGLHRTPAEFRHAPVG